MASHEGQSAEGLIKPRDLRIEITPSSNLHQIAYDLQKEVNEMAVILTKIEELLDDKRALTNAWTRERIRELIRRET